MKRFLFLLVLLLTLTSCTPKNKIPTFDGYPITLSGTLSCNGTCIAVTAVIQDHDTCNISIDSPDNLSGYSFVLDNSCVWVYYDDMEIELDPGSINIPLSVLPKMLRVSREEFEYSRTDSENTIYYYTNDSADTVIHIRRGEELPCRIEYRSEGMAVTLDIESFLIQ